MTAFDLIDSIFSRVQAGVPGDERRVTERQLAKLEELIGEDPEGAAYVSCAPNQKVWRPSGSTRYILTRQGPSTRRSIKKIPNVEPMVTGLLF